MKYAYVFIRMKDLSIHPFHCWHHRGTSREQKKKWTGSDLTYKQMREHQCSARKLEKLPSWGTLSMLSSFLVTQLNILFFDCCKVPDELKVNQISKTWETFLVTGGIISAAKLWALEMLKVQTERQVKLLS